VKIKPMPWLLGRSNARVGNAPTGKGGTEMPGY